MRMIKLLNTKARLPRKNVMLMMTITNEFRLKKA